ncbi:MAG: hypothetical protein ABW051_04780 [Burkholderiaceae bacterium]
MDKPNTPSSLKPVARALHDAGGEGPSARANPSTEQRTSAGASRVSSDAPKGWSAARDPMSRLKKPETEVGPSMDEFFGMWQDCADRGGIAWMAFLRWCETAEKARLEPMPGVQSLLVKVMAPPARKGRGKDSVKAAAGRKKSATKPR